MAAVVKGICLDLKDNVVTVMKKADKSVLVYWDGQEGAPIPAIDNIPAFHKIAIREIPAGSAIVKYGHAIGIAAEIIACGVHVHTQNCVGMAKRSG